MWNLYRSIVTFCWARQCSSNFYFNLVFLFVSQGHHFARWFKLLHCEQTLLTPYGTVSAKIAPRLKCYKNASRLNRYNFPTDNAIDFLFSALYTTPFHYEVLKIGVDSVIRWEVIAIQTRCIFITFLPWGNFRGNCPI